MKRSQVLRKLLLIAVSILTFVVGFGTLYFRNPVVLEVTTHGYGMVYPSAEVLEMRVYENGRVEYDVYPPQEAAELKIRYWFPMQHSKLTSDEVNELMRLAEQPDFLSAQEQYGAGHQHIDDSWKTTIRFSYRGREKRIVAINFWDITDRPEDSSKYPPSMVTLLKKVRALRVKLAGQP